MFTKKTRAGKLVRNRSCIDCSKDEVITEQSHKKEVDINEIVKRHGLDLLQKSANQMFDIEDYKDITSDDFQQSMNKVLKAQDAFDALPSKIRDKFENNPAKYLDFINDRSNIEDMIEMGIAERREPEQPIEVIVTNQGGEKHEESNEELP